MSKDISLETTEYIGGLCDRFEQINHIEPFHYANANVKRGLRNADGTGVIAGLTLIGNVHGYLINEGDKIPDDGKLTYRGYDVNDIVHSCEKENRYGFEEVVFLLLFGWVPNATELEEFVSHLTRYRHLPRHFTEDQIIRSPSRDLMNKMASCTLSLYSYDPLADDLSLPNIMRQCIELTARFPMIAAHALQVKRHVYDKESLYIHFADEKLSTAENILRTIRPNSKFTPTEARLLDLALILHAEHGGGNNSTFAARVLASSATDTYSAMSAAIGSLKGAKHGGANIQVVNMFENIKANVSDWGDDEEVGNYIRKILRKEAADGSGLVYGMGHAIYTKTDPRAILLKENAIVLANEKGRLDEFKLIDAVERLTPGIFAEETGSDKAICANIDLYSGFVYDMLDIPKELYTPLFAISRVAGWSAHIIEEFTLGGRIMRPAYKSVVKSKEYIPLSQR
jgi:citrate synthase